MTDDDAHQDKGAATQASPERPTEPRDEVAGAPRRGRGARGHEPEGEAIAAAEGEKVTGWRGVLLPVLRWAAPILAVILYASLAIDEILVDAGWLPLIAAVVLAPAFALERRRRDGIALVLLVVGASAAGGLTGPPAAGAAIGALALATLVSAPFLFFSTLAEGLG